VLEHADRAVPDPPYIYYVGTSGIAVYLITSPQGPILIDTVLPQATPQIRSSIAKPGRFMGVREFLACDHPLVGDEDRPGSGVERHGIDYLLQARQRESSPFAGCFGRL
jgi:hypothetical protein